MSNVVSLFPRGVVTAEEAMPEPVNLVETQSLLDFFASRARQGQVDGVLVIAYDPMTRTFDHAFAAPSAMGSSTAALAMIGALELARDGLKDFAKETADYEASA